MDSKRRERKKKEDQRREERRFQDWEALVPRFGNQQFFKLGTCGSKIGKHCQKKWTLNTRKENAVCKYKGS